MGKVAIWGHWYGNYGDDAMTIHVATAVARLGHHPFIFRLPKSLREKYGVGEAETFPELLRGASLCLFVAGGVLTDFRMPHFEADIARLSKECEQVRCPVHAVSIGGQGLQAILSPEREGLFRSDVFRSATVRLSSDVATLRRFIPRVDYYPDMLLSVEDTWPLSQDRPERSEIHIGFNSSQDFPESADVIAGVMDMHPNVVLHVMNNISDSNRYSRSDLMPVTVHPRIHLHAYTDPGETIRVIQSLDILVSHKLHLGVTALAFGVQFLSYGNSPKVQAFLDGAGLSNATLGGTIETCSFNELLGAALACGTVRPLPFRALAKLKRQSRGHVEMLASVLSKLA